MALPFLLFAGSSLLSFRARSARDPSDGPTRGAVMRKAKPRPPEVAESIAAVELWSWAAWVRRSVTGLQPRVFHDAFSGPNAPLSEALKRRGWIVASRDVLLSALHDLPAVAALCLRWTPALGTSS